MYEMTCFFLQIMAHLWKLGYAPEDIITNIFRVAKHLEINESLKLKFVQVKYLLLYIKC